MSQFNLFGAEQEIITTDDYYTPEARGHPLAALHHYSMIDDGLASPWVGRVWMNPPFSNATPWVRKFTEHHNGVCLVPAAKSAWFDTLWESDAALVSLPANFKFSRENVMNTSIFIRVLLAGLR